MQSQASCRQIPTGQRTPRNKLTDKRLFSQRLGKSWLVGKRPPPNFSPIRTKSVARGEITHRSSLDASQRWRNPLWIQRKWWLGRGTMRTRHRPTQNSHHNQINTDEIATLPRRTVKGSRIGVGPTSHCTSPRHLSALLTSAVGKLAPGWAHKRMLPKWAPILAKTTPEGELFAPLGWTFKFQAATRVETFIWGFTAHRLRVGIGCRVRLRENQEVDHRAE